MIQLAREQLRAPRPAPHQGGNRITFRAILIAAAIMPFSITWQLIVEQGMMRSSQAIFALLSLLFNCLFYLLILMVLNAALHKFLPKKSLTSGELLTIYILLTGVTISCGLVEGINPFIAYPIQYAEAKDPAVVALTDTLARLFLITDKRTASAYWLGQTNLFRGGYWREWLPPILLWTLLFAAVLFGLLCLSLLVRRLWADQERLTFPIIQLPMQLTTEPGVFRVATFWTGFGVAASIALVNGLHQFFPSFPNIPTRALILQASSSPWNAVGAFRIFFYPFAIGMGFLIPLNLAFSTWFFILFQNLELVAARAANLDTASRFPFLAEQSTGALLGLILFRLILQRQYFRSLAHKAFQRQHLSQEPSEAVSYRLAILGFCVAISILAGLCFLVGITPLAAVLFILLYFVQSLGVARLRAELGPPAHDIWQSDISMLLLNGFGTRVFSKTTVAGLHLLRGFSGTTGCHPMPSQLEGLQMAKRLHLKGSSPFWSIFAFMTLGFGIAMLILAGLEHRFGAATPLGGPMVDGEPATPGYIRAAVWLPLVNHVQVGQTPQNTQTAALLGGVIFALLLDLMATRFAAWPFHPVGFVIAQSWYVATFMWASIFLAWLIKLLILRYSGRVGYSKALPFFYGLIIGDCIVGVAWATIGFLMHVPTYPVWA